MKDLDAFLPSIKPYAPGAADPTLFFGIRQAAIEFCERTRLWRHEDDFDVTDTEAQALLAPNGAVVHEIERVLFDGAPMEPKTPGDLDRLLPDWRLGEVSGSAAYVTQTEPNTLRLVPANSGHVYLYLWLKPAQDAEEVPDFLVDQYRQVIAYGALGYVLLTPGQPYTNPDMAAAFANAFQSRLDALSTKGATGQQRATVRTRPSFF